MKFVPIFLIIGFILIAGSKCQPQSDVDCGEDYDYDEITQSDVNRPRPNPGGGRPGPGGGRPGPPPPRPLPPTTPWPWPSGRK